MTIKIEVAELDALIAGKQAARTQLLFDAGALQEVIQRKLDEARKLEGGIDTLDALKKQNVDS